MRNCLRTKKTVTSKDIQLDYLEGTNIHEVQKVQITGQQYYFSTEQHFNAVILLYLVHACPSVFT